MTRRTLRVVTRRSDLALLQTSLIITPLLGGSRLSKDISIELVPNDTFGDAGKYRQALAASKAAGEADNKRKWIHELEVAVHSGEVDIAVHSGKDYPAVVMLGTQIIPLLEREDPRDCFVSRDGTTFKNLKPGSIVGTASKRRAGQVLNMRPDLRIQEYTGNVVTRISEATMRDKKVDGIVVAYAGIKRLGDVVSAQTRKRIEVFDTEQMMPAVNQGILLGQCRSDDEFARSILNSLRREQTAIVWAAERAVIETMEADCKSAVSVYAKFEEPAIVLIGVIVYSDNGAIRASEMRKVPPAEATAAGIELGRAVLKKLGGSAFG